MTAHLGWIDDELSRLRNESLYRAPRSVIPRGNGRCQIEGRELIDFGSNDYLDLATSETLKTASHAAIDSYGIGARASASVSGIHPEYQRLAKSLANFEQAESALLYPTGYMANVGTISALVGPDDTVFCDRLNHASLVDGCRLSRARFRVYPHGDMKTLQRELEKTNSVGRKLIVTDGLFSMDGDLAPLPELWALTEEYDALLLVDEAHATGIFGEHGRGSVEYFGLADKPIIRVGTLSKAIGCLGGFVSGSQAFIDLLRNRARTQIYATGLPAGICAAASVAIHHIQTHPEDRMKLIRLSELLRHLLSKDGISYAPGACGPIIPVILNDAEFALRVSERLQASGFFVPAIRPPTVPAETSRLRITLSVAHSESDIESLVTHLKDVL